MPKYLTRFAETVDLEISPPLTMGDGDSLANDIAIPNTPQINLVLTVNASQYTQLLSAAISGAFIEDPLNWQEVVYPLIKAGKVMSVFDCNDVADCINGNAIVQDSITNVLNNNGTVNPNRIDAENTTGADRIPNASTESVSSPPPGCDKDALWAGIVEMVNRIDQNGRDILEDLAIINDKIEQIAEVIDLVPLLGDTIKDIADFFTEVIPDLLNAYNSASSPTFLDNVACDLFELVCNECRYPTYDEVFEYFRASSGLSVPVLAVATYAQTWNVVKAVSVLVPETVWYAINLWQCLTLLFDGYFGRSYGKKSFAIWASFGEDNPNNNWEILCSGCADLGWAYDIDFTSEQGEWVARMSGATPLAVWANGIGWQSVDFSGHEQLQVGLEIADFIAWNYIELEYTRAGSTGAAFDDERIFIMNALDAQTALLSVYSEANIATNGLIVKCLNPLNNTNTRKIIAIYLRCNSASGALVLKRAKVWSTDTALPVNLIDNSTQDCV